MSSTGGGDHRFGGDWTARKLEVVGKYLAAYSTALRDKPTAERPFRKAFIDGFAGTGARSDSAAGATETNDQDSLFPDDTEGESPRVLLDGSARIALRTEPAFDRYIFIERSQQRCNALEELKIEFAPLADRIVIRPGDANAEIRNLCSKDWSSNRAVMFLDPYGMQVEWATIEAIAATQAIDLWLLFPLGIGVNRLLTRSGDIPESWQRRLTLLLGDESWRTDGYSVESQPTLFGDDEERVTKVAMEVLGAKFKQRLEGIFPGVAEPGMLRNSRGRLLYLLCFAVANPRGVGPGLNIANDLLRNLR